VQDQAKTKAYLPSDCVLQDCFFANAWVLSIWHLIVLHACVQFRHNVLSIFRAASPWMQLFTAPWASDGSCRNVRAPVATRRWAWLPHAMRCRMCLCRCGDWIFCPSRGPAMMAHGVADWEREQLDASGNYGVG